MARVGLILFVGLVLSSEQTMAQNSVFLEELTWTEVHDAIQAGKTTVIIPTGGTEQNGPHMILGKHNIIVPFTAGEFPGNLVMLWSRRSSRMSPKGQLLLLRGT